MTSTLTTRSAFMRQGQRILPEYSSLEHQRWWPAAKVFAIATLVFLSVFMGLLTVAGGISAVGFMAVPLAAMFGLMLWMLPDVDRVSQAPFYKLLAAYLICIMAWPSYVAIALPGLPWITPARIVQGILIITAILHFAQYPDARQRAMSVLGHDRLILRLYICYFFTQFLALPFAQQLVSTFTYNIQNEILNITALVAAAYLFTNPDKIMKLIKIVMFGAILTMLISLVENFMQKPPWINNIPSFMRIDEKLLEFYLSPQSRIGDGRYRIRSVFPAVLYYTQYLGLVLPLLFFAITKMRGPKLFTAVALSALVLQTVWFCNARTSFISLFVVLFGYAGLVALRINMGSGRRDSLKAGIQFSLVVLMVVMLAGAIASSHSLKMYTFGGQQHTDSDATRDDQWANTWKQLRINPIGVGIGNSSATVGTPYKDTLVVDSLYINLLVGVGPLGFLCFFGMFVRVTWIGIRTFLRAGNELEELSGALALSMVNFILSAYVISNLTNNYLLFLLAGAILAINRAQQMRLGAQPQSASLPAPSASTALAVGR